MTSVHGWCIHPSAVTSPSTPSPLAQCWSCCFQMHVNKQHLKALVPWCVSVCQSLWFRMADGGKKGEGDGEIFPSISRVLVPLADTHCHSAVHSQNAVCVCVLAQSRAVVAGADRETGSVFAGPRQWRKWRRDFMCNQSVNHPIEQLYISHLSITAPKCAFYSDTLKCEWRLLLLTFFQTITCCETPLVSLCEKTTPTSFSSLFMRWLTWNKSCFTEEAITPLKIMFPAVSLHTNSPPLVVPSWQPPVKALYMECGFLFLDWFSEGILLWQRGFIWVFFLSWMLIRLHWWKMQSVCMCAYPQAIGEVYRPRVTFWGDEIIVSGAGCWLCCWQIEWAPTWNRLGKPLSYFSALSNVFLFYILLYSVNSLPLLERERLSLIPSAVWTNRASACRTAHQL